ncbi:MAG: YkgJ family cysteine cluster protein [Deltaproteobacteria bacterium]|nr:YkgJ family cysteine cluster protein [Deltaproteobacteria bacterium]
MSTKTIRAPEARFTCEGDGRCCTRWSVPVSAEVVERLRAHDWTGVGAGDPFLPVAGSGEPFRLRLVDERCFFLDAENRCEIQKRLGHEAKPAACKAFPLQLTSIGGQTHARLSFYCPTVCADRGKRLSEQQRWLKTVERSAEVHPRCAPLRLSPDIEIGLRDQGEVDRELARRLGETGASMADRLATCVGLLQVIQSQHSEGGIAVAMGLKRASAMESGELARLGREGGEAPRAGPVLSLFLASDCLPGPWAKAGHFFGVRFFGLGLSKLRSRAMGAKASRGRIAAVTFAPGEEGDALLTRYFIAKLVGRRHLADQLDLLRGFNLLVVAYGMIVLLARLKAASEGQPGVRQSDLLAAVQATELLVLEHTAIHRTSSFSHLLEKILDEPTLCSSMLARAA